MTVPVSFLNGLIFVALVVGSGCAPDMDPEPLRIISTAPEEAGEHVADRPVRIAFDRYLDPATVWSRVARLDSGEARFGISTTYDPVDRSIVIRPRAPLRPGLGFVATLDPAQFAAMDGARLTEEFELTFLSTPAMEPPSSNSDAFDFATDLVPVIEERCGCHGPTEGAFPSLDPESLIRQPSQRQPERILVQPGQPLQSYLIQRLLRDYPGVRGRPKTLTDDEIRLFITWVNRIGVAH